MCFPIYDEPEAKGGGVSLFSFFRSVSVKIVTVPVAAFVLGLLIPGLLGYSLLLRQAERETHEKALAALELLSAVRHYADDESNSRTGFGAGVVHHGAIATNQVIRRYEAGRHEDSF